MLRVLVVLVVVALASGGCGSSEPAVTSATTLGTTATPTATPTTTISAAVVVTLPVDDSQRTPAVPATADFEPVASQPAFDALVREVVTTVERLHPGGEGESLRTESTSGTSGTTGTVLVRRTGLPDDSLAGYEYTVTAKEGAAGWAVESATKVTLCRRGVSGNLCL